MFKIKKLHLERLKKAIKVYGTIHLHGDGNMYTDEPSQDGQMSNSDFRKDFSDPKIESASYRLTFKSVEAVPGSVEEVEKMFLHAKATEKYDESIPKAESSFRGLPKEEPEDLDLNLGDEEIKEPGKRGRKQK